jgi:hypothetical protein
MDRLALYCIFEKVEVSKVDYPSKAKSSNDRGVGTFFFDTCLNLGHLLQNNFKNWLRHFPRNEIPITNIKPSDISWNFFRPVLKLVSNFVLVGVLKYENITFCVKIFFLICQEYST